MGMGWWKKPKKKSWNVKGQEKNSAKKKVKKRKVMHLQKNCTTEPPLPPPSIIWSGPKEPGPRLVGLGR